MSKGTTAYCDYSNNLLKYKILQCIITQHFILSNPLVQSSKLPSYQTSININSIAFKGRVFFMQMYSILRQCDKTLYAYEQINLKDFWMIFFINFVYFLKYQHAPRYRKDNRQYSNLAFKNSFMIKYFFSFECRATFDNFYANEMINHFLK